MYAYRRERSEPKSPPRTAWIQGLDRDSSSLFGTTAREMTKPVVGFHIRAERERLTRIENITAAAAKPAAAYRSSTGELYFLLMDDEVVMQSSYSTDSDGVTAIRFDTNWRGPSQWFGKLRGSVRTHTAPSDGVIHSVCAQRDRYGGYNNVGVVIWKVDRPPRPAVFPDREVREVRVLKSPCVPDESVVHSVARDLSAVWIQYAANSIQAIEALSKIEYERLVMLQEQVSLPMNEHIVRILPNERITGVAFLHTLGNALTAIRFETSRRTTPWFSATVEKTEVQTEGSFHCTRGAFICGFFASRVDQVSFGLLVDTPRASTAAAENV